jgi:hypothetical protein
MPFKDKEKKRESAAAYYAANKEKVRAKGAAYYAANREKVLAQQKEYDAANREKKRAYKKENREKTRAYMKEYYAENREKSLAYRKEYYAENREKSLAYRKEYYAENREKSLAYMKEHRVANLEVYMWRGAKHRAKAKNIPFTITPNDIVIPPTCPVLGIPLQRGCGKSGPTPNSPSLDRIVPTRGYVPGNVVVVSHRANTIKNDATPDELALVTAFYQQIWNKSMEPKP